MDNSYPGIPEEAFESADRMMSLVKNGRIRQHLLGDTSRIRHGTVEDLSMDQYCNFLKTKLCYEIMSLRGEPHHE